MRHFPLTGPNVAPGRFRKIKLAAVPALAGLLAVSCAPQYSAPQQVRANNPSVTYKYHNDQELLTVNQNALTFCNQYRSAPRAARFATEPDGKLVVFECAPAAIAATPSVQYNPNLTYNYQTDPELLEASQNARTYCMNNGSQQAISNIVTNANGTRTVTFQCSRI